MDETSVEQIECTPTLEAVAFPIELWVEEIDPADAEAKLVSHMTSKPLAQSKSKYAFPFGAQICTARTYSVF